MAESDGRRSRLPIKLILPEQGQEGRVPGGRSDPVPFRKVDAVYRRRLANQTRAIQDVVAQGNDVGAAPVRVKLISRAAAKTHRPDKLFSNETCPIVGAGALGELFVKATTGGLERLAHRIERDQSKQVVKEISCVEAIEPITPAFRRNGFESLDLLRKSPKRGDRFVTRVRLFNFADADQARLVESFEKECRTRGIKLDHAGYTPKSYTYSAGCRTASDVEALSSIVGVRSVAGMPTMRTLRQRMFNVKALPRMVTRADVAGDVPVVVVVDSGISADVPALESWVFGRESYVAAPYRNTDHGTFVAGLICWGATLNPTLRGIDDAPCGVFDVHVIPNDDPAKGDTESLTEHEFLQTLDQVLEQHANRYKVWNLSLGTDAVCSLQDFSEFAVELDNLQEKYQVSFVIAAGNYTSPPLLNFPRSGHELDNGRITAPADSVLGITVGSVSQVDYQDKGPKDHELSAFSRHGAGPNYVIKPDLVQYGGACSLDFSHITGVRSINGSGTAENMGTSFAAPLVSRTLAQIYHRITPTPSPVLARALLTHHARDPRTGDRVPDGDENFFGFGLPAVAPTCLECSPYMSTLVFEDVLRQGFYLEWDAFPYPPSLKRNGRYFGDIWMTVAFAPARGQRWGSEYCETHIDAHFGVYRQKVNKETGVIEDVFTGLVPPEHKNPGVLFESYQVEKLRKWAPVRTYYGSMGRRGKLGDRWRLMVRLLTRHEDDRQEAHKPQPFSLIVTIADPEQRVNVYDEMAQQLANRFESQNLAVRAAARIRTRG